MVGPAVILHFLPDGFYRGYCIDALFQSLGRHAGPRTIGVILSGILKDGSPGLSAIKEAGGLAFVQVPGEAEYKDMPSNAVAFDGPIDLVGSFQAIAEEIRLRTETLRACLPILRMRRSPTREDFAGLDRHSRRHAARRK